MWNEPRHLLQGDDVNRQNATKDMTKDLELREEETDPEGGSGDPPQVEDLNEIPDTVEAGELA